VTDLSRRQFLGVAGAASASVARPAHAETPLPSQGPHRITLACADYVRFMPLALGDVRSDGLDLVWLRGDRAEMLRRATGDPAVHGGEASMAQHLMRIDRGDRSLVAVPVFPLRNFTVRDLYVLKGSPLGPADLGRLRIGIYNWAASGAVWYRHLLRHVGHETARVRWVVGSPDSAAPVNPGVPLPSNVRLAPAGQSLTDLLLAREIDVFFAPLPPSRYHPDKGPIVRLVPDFRPVEQRYFRETGCYPPQHVVVLRREIWQRDPAVGPRLVSVCNECERRFQAGQRLFPYSTPWQMAEIEDTERAMGQSFHAHGLEPNRRALETFCQGGFDDGLTKRRVSVDEFFAEFLSP
jgi:4,5-dihydroxyphthalate decarboxylase